MVQWTDELDRKMRVHIEVEKLTFRECAAKMKLTRSQVAGRYNRVFGTMPRYGGERKPKQTRKPPRQKSSMPEINAGKPLQSKNGVGWSAAADRDAVFVPDPDCGPPKPGDPHFIGPIDLPTIWEGTEKTCKWPIARDGKGVWRFCGKPVYAGHSQPYCLHHVRKAYRRVQQGQTLLAEKRAAMSDEERASKSLFSKSVAAD